MSEYRTDRAQQDPVVGWAGRVVGTGAKRWVFFGAVALGIFSAPDLAVRPSLALSAVATLAAAAWCLTNFWHCQEAHCLVTGPGWSLLGVFELAELGLGHSLIGGAEQVPFLAVLAAAVLFELYWRARYGTGSLTPSQRRVPLLWRRGQRRQPGRHPRPGLGHEALAGAARRAPL